MILPKLCSFSTERSVKRRGDHPNKAEITDILDLFRKYDENDISIPTFVADSFDSMPPTAGYDLIAPMLMSLVDELSGLKKDLMTFKDIGTVHRNIIFTSWSE